MEYYKTCEKVLYFLVPIPILNINGWQSITFVRKKNHSFLAISQVANYILTLKDKKRSTHKRTLMRGTTKIKTFSYQLFLFLYSLYIIIFMIYIYQYLKILYIHFIYTIHTYILSLATGFV